MPPKSANKKKKEEDPKWVNCSACDINFLVKDVPLHEKHCPIAPDDPILNTLDFVRNKYLQTSSYRKMEVAMPELDHFDPKYTNNMIYVSDMIFRMLDLRIGQQVVIQSVNNSNAEVLIRMIWPLRTENSSTVYVPNADLDSAWRTFLGGPIKIQCIRFHVCHPAKRVELLLRNPDDFNILTDKVLEEMAVVAKKEMVDLIYTDTNTMRLDYFNKTLDLKVKSIELYEPEPDPEDSGPNITENITRAIETLTLEDKKLCFVIKRTTQVYIRCAKTENEAEQVETEPIDKQKDFSVTLHDIGGLDGPVHYIKEIMMLATGVPRTRARLRLTRGVILYGPSGCGKTLICDAFTNFFMEVYGKDSGLVLHINPSELFSKFLGETEKNLKTYFARIYEHFPSPTLLIIEDLHHLCPKNEEKDLTRRVNAALCNMIDELFARSEGQRCLILATTSDLANVHTGLRRNGRFEQEYFIGVPSANARHAIIQCMLDKIQHTLSPQEVRDLAACAHGFVGADIANLVCAAGLDAMQYFAGKEPILNANNFRKALQMVKPSAMKEIMIQNPSVRWSDIGGNDDLKLKLKQSIEWPINHPDKFAQLGIRAPKGILLYGPPGCSKTMFAKAVATESQLNFISIKGPEIFSMYVGESERAIRDIFNKARQVAPTIIFFDEIDAIGSSRGDGGGDGGGSSVKERVLTQMLTELDGVQSLENVVIIAATNRPDMIDKALLRPGRIDRLIYVGLPDVQCRQEIFRIKLKKVPTGPDVEVKDLVERTEGYTGAEIEALCHEAALKALEETFEASHVTWKHFEHAFKLVRPRTNRELLDLYENYRANEI